MGVAKLFNELYLSDIIRHIANKFGIPSSYGLYDLHVHTDRHGFIGSAADTVQKYISFMVFSICNMELS